jgi:hypothetical protein
MTYDRPFSSNLLPASIRNKAKDKITKIRQIKLIPVLSPVSEKRIRNASPYWRNIGLDGCYFFPRHKPKEIKSSQEMIFISGVKSPEEFIQTTIKILEIIEQDLEYLLEQ